MLGHGHFGQISGLNLDRRTGSGWQSSHFWRNLLFVHLWSVVAGVAFADSDSAPVQNFWIRVRQFFKYENSTPVQTPATIIDPTVICPWFYFRDDRTDPCYCRNRKLIPDPGLVFHKFLTSGPDLGPKGKRRILPESTLALRPRCQAKFLTSVKFLTYYCFSGILLLRINH